MPDADRNGEGEGLGGIDAWPACLGSIELVWHRLNRSHDLARFLRSDVRWAECDARLEPGGSIVVSHSAGDQGDRPFAEWLGEVAHAGRRAKVDLKESGPVLEGVLDAIADTDGMRGERLWFNAAIEVVGGSAGFDRISQAVPGARLSCPIDNLASWLLVTSARALHVLDEVRGWGIDRLSVSVRTPAFQEVIAIAKQGGWATNVWGVSTDVQLADAVAAHPTSITADLGLISPTSWSLTPSG